MATFSAAFPSTEEFGLTLNAIDCGDATTVVVAETYDGGDATTVVWPLTIECGTANNSH
jgi:hypothetical protein